jgi:CRP/FNR family transcriptional regulator, cyclic AMP receptor protein
MTRETWLDHLAKVPMFSKCSTKELQHVASATTPITLPPGRVLVREGEYGHDAFVIVEGTATVERDHQMLATLGPGDVVGELAPLTAGPRTATVTALGDLQVLVMDRREFNGLLDDIPGFAIQVLHSLAERMSDLDEKAYG